MKVILRAAVAADSYCLWLWANDPATRAASGTPNPIEWDHHLTWLAGRLGSPAALILVAESPTGRPLGTIRFETGDAWVSARLSYTVAPECRGQGVGRALLEQGPKVLGESGSHSLLVALARPANLVSRHLFESLGWAEDGSTVEWIRFVSGGRIQR